MESGMYLGIHIICNNKSKSSAIMVHSFILHRRVERAMCLEKIVSWIIT